MTIRLTIFGEPVSKFSRVTYIYALVDPHHRIRYIGKADRPYRRFERHMCDTDDTRKARWIRSLRRAGRQPTLSILACVPLERWQEAERYWIEREKANGAELTNSTDGGRGPLSPSEETRAKMRQRKLGRSLTDAHRQKVSSALRGKPKPPRTPEHLSNLSAACVGRVIGQAQRQILAVRGREGKPRNALGLKGVYFDRDRGKFQAHIKVNKKMIHLGRYETAKAAALAYNEAAIAHGWPDSGLNPV